MAYQRPRIVIEESPWGKFFQELPSMFLSFRQRNQQMEFQAAEAEKDRQFKESQLYLKDLINTKQLLQKSILDSTKIAQTKGLSFEVAFGKLASSSPESVTPGGSKTASDYMGLLQQDISTLKNEYSDNLDQIDLANLGINAAMAIDTDFSGSIDTNELDAYQKASPQLLEELGVPQLPEAFIRGAQNAITSSPVRKQQKENKRINDTGIVLDALSKLPGYSENKNLEAANILNIMNPGSANVYNQIEKAITDQPDPVKQFKEDLQATDVTFRNIMEGLESSRAGVLDNFTKGLKVQGTEDYKVKSLMDPKFITSFKKDIGENLAVWFSGKTREGDSYGPGKPEADWIKEAFNAAPANGWKNPELAVEQVMTHRNWSDLISDPEKIGDAFDWTGQGLLNLKNEAEESAANNFFLKSVEAYELVDDIDRRSDGGYSPTFLKTIGAQGTQPGTPASGAPVDTSQVTVPADASQVPADTSQIPSAAGFTDQSQFLAEYGYPERIEEPRSYLDRSMAYALPGAPGAFNYEEIEESLRTLSDKAYVDPSIPPRLASNLRDALDKIDTDSQLRDLVTAITSSPNLKSEFAQTGKDVDVASIIDNWKEKGYPDVGDFLIDQFPDIEPEFIR